MKGSPNDAMATDYQNAFKRGGKRRMAEAIKLEMDRREQEQKLLDRQTRTLRDTEAFAHCSCGWSLFGPDAVRVADQAHTHMLKHKHFDGVSSELTSRVMKSGLPNETGEILIDRLAQPFKLRPIPMGH